MATYDEILTNVLAETGADGVADLKAAQAITDTQRFVLQNLRAPINEKLWRDTVNSIYETTVPSDFLMMKTLLIDGVPVNRIVDLETIIKYQNPPYDTSDEKMVARFGTVFLYPAYYVGADSLLYYNAELPFISSSNQTNKLSEKAPDLIEAGAIAKVYRFLKQKEDYDRWKEEFNIMWKNFNELTLDADFKGAPVVVPGDLDFFTEG